MSNYVIEDEVKNYSVPSVTKPTPKGNGINKKSLVIVIVFIVLALIVFLVINNYKSNSFSSYEKNMVSSARNYVSNNGITTNKEIYIDVSKLNVNLPNSCSLLSGVIYDGNNYEPYLLCSNYESEIINNDVEDKSSFKLKGSNIVVLQKGMEYYELGYDSDEPVSISSSTISKEGVYNIYYILGNSGLVFTRKVIVIDNPNLNNMFPAINISSEDPIMIERGKNYNELVTALDSTDGDLTDKIIKNSNLDINTPGEYKIIYSVRNSLGYTTNVMKRILVVDDLSTELNIMTLLSNDNITNESISVSVNVVGGDYSYTKLPDGTETNQREFQYLIEKNGDYEFIAVTSTGKETREVLKITNIDKTIPEGTCLATMYSDRTNINVTIKSFNYVVTYDYYVDNVNSGSSTSSFYNSNKTNPTEVYVIAKDYIGNEGKIVCTKNDKQSNMNPNGITTLINQGNRIREPISDMLARRGYTVNDLNTCIYNRVKDAGPYTRYGVTAAAFGLIDCTNSMIGAVMSYDHVGGRTDSAPASGGTYCTFNSDLCGKLGINRRWGVNKSNTCSSTQCWYGLNCATFVRWAMCNGGMNLCTGGSNGGGSMASTDFFPEADIVTITGKSVKYKAGKDLTHYTADTLVRMIKPGDVIHTYTTMDHVFMVVGVDDKYIYTAEDGYFMRKVSYSSMTSGGQPYRLLFLDNYYANQANRNNLYN